MWCTQQLWTPVSKKRVKLKVGKWTKWTMSGYEVAGAAEGCYGLGKELGPRKKISSKADQIGRGRDLQSFC
ncbi:hypothetical protein PPACK8108_LOCUS13547, partial [Phakopsora pachyrhizi]